MELDNFKDGAGGRADSSDGRSPRRVSCMRPQMTSLNEDDDGEAAAASSRVTFSSFPMATHLGAEKLDSAAWLSQSVPLSH